MRASRLLSILMLLQLRDRLTAEVLAAEFEVSVRTIYRDIDRLAEAGVPVYADRGPGGGFRLVDGYRTRLTGLAADEVEAMFMIGLPGPAAALGMGPAASNAGRKMLASNPENFVNFQKGLANLAEKDLDHALETGAACGDDLPLGHQTRALFRNIIERMDQ